MPSWSNRIAFNFIETSILRNLSNINNLSEISDQYDAFLIDAWGVLHEGGKVFPHAYECLKQLNRMIKPL